MSIHSDMKTAGIECAHHESDLYVPDSPEARAILAEHDKKIDGWNVQLFDNQITGTRWLDIPFQWEG